jgi:glycosyltransferase involved in cell wall biosynthesis
VTKMASVSPFAMHSSRCQDDCTAVHPAGASPYLSIVLPCYNEAANIGVLLSRLSGIVQRTGMTCEIFVVDDGSRDDTAAAAERAGSDLGLAVRVLRHKRNGGYGQALRTGFAAATGRYIFLTDGDGQFALGELPEAVRLLCRADAVLGYRRVRRDSLPRRWMGKCWTLLINLCLQVCIRDVDCAFKLVDARLLKRADLGSRGALISTEMIAHLAGAGVRILQRPVEHLPRRAGKPTGARPAVVLRAFLELARNLPRLRRIRQGQCT